MTQTTSTARSSFRFFVRLSQSSNSGGSSKFTKHERRKMEKPQKDQVIQALVQVALLEAKNILTHFAEIVAYLERQEYLAARGTMMEIQSQYQLLDAVLSAAARF